MVLHAILFEIIIPFQYKSDDFLRIPEMKTEFILIKLERNAYEAYLRNNEKKAIHLYIFALKRLHMDE